MHTMVLAVALPGFAWIANSIAKQGYSIDICTFVNNVDLSIHIGLIASFSRSGVVERTNGLLDRDHVDRQIGECLLR